jgi:hypothetical protein
VIRKLRSDGRSTDSELSEGCNTENCAPRYNDSILGPYPGSGSESELSCSQTTRSHRGASPLKSILGPIPGMFRAAGSPKPVIAISGRMKELDGQIDEARKLLQEQALTHIPDGKNLWQIRNGKHRHKDAWLNSCWDNLLTNGGYFSERHVIHEKDIVRIGTMNLKSFWAPESRQHVKLLPAISRFAGGRILIPMRLLYDREWSEALEKERLSDSQLKKLAQVMIKKSDQNEILPRDWSTGLEHFVRQYVLGGFQLEELYGERCQRCKAMVTLWDKPHDNLKCEKWPKVRK